MGVVFDEVVTQVEAPPPSTESSQQASDSPQSPQQTATVWHQQQATFWRRQQRLEAD